MSHVKRWSMEKKSSYHGIVDASDDTTSERLLRLKGFLSIAGFVASSPAAFTFILLDSIPVYPASG